MKLMGKDITPAKVMAFVEDRLAARGLVSSPPRGEVTIDGVEARVDPLSFNLHALEDNADATRGLPLETHRDGLGGRAVMLAKRVFRKAGQIFINETLGRQRVFNGHVRDSYAQLSAEVLKLRQRVAELERDAAVETPPAPVMEMMQEMVTPPVIAIPKIAKPKAPAPKSKPLPPPPPPPAPARTAAKKPAPSAPRNTRRGK